MHNLYIPLKVTCTTIIHGTPHRYGLSSVRNEKERGPIARPCCMIRQPVSVFDLLQRLWHNTRSSSANPECQGLLYSRDTRSRGRTQTRIHFRTGVLLLRTHASALGWDTFYWHWMRVRKSNFDCICGPSLRPGQRTLGIQFRRL